MSRYTVAELLRKNRSARSVNEPRVAVTYQRSDLTYEQLDARSSRLASALAAQGFGHGDRVAVVLYNRLEWTEVFFAVAKLGGVVVPINHLLRASEVEYILDDSGASWVVYESALAHTLGGLLASERTRSYIQLDGAAGTDGAAGSTADQEDQEQVPPGRHDYEALLESGSATEFVPDGYVVDADDLLLLQYTSGTTGAPKGAMHTHSTVLWNSIHQVIDFGITAKETFMVVPSLCWAAGFHDLALATLWSGGRIVLSPSTGFAPRTFLESVADERVTSVLLVPTVLKRVLAEPSLTEHDLSSLRLVCSGGEPVPLISIENMHAKLPTCSLLQCYGMSEFPTMMLIGDPDDAHKKAGSTGRAATASEIRVVDADGIRVEPGIIGEIICRSPANMLGYYHNDQATREALIDGWLHTGDLATVDDEGFVYVSGRSKDMIITGGLNVYPAEVERIIAGHPAVLEAAVVGAPDDDWGEIGVALVVLADGQTLTEDELLAYLRPALATYKLPRRLLFSADPLPRTTSGKVQKFKVRTALAG